ncbi:MAG TPA: ATP-binding protein [Bacteroidia bacterium]|jgi:two-component system phosphate regulon sensor histidine kinase PhoR|nr:ATP-binding protein [Bacteroidia bacterium]
MKKSIRYIPILITLALLSLIGLQIVWLIDVYKYKNQELKDKTTEAVLETTKRLQREEDSKLILNNIDSLLLTDNIIGGDAKSDIRIIVSSIKDNLKIDTFRVEKGKHIEHKLKVINDSNETTTIVKVGNNKIENITVTSGSHLKEDFQKYIKEFHKLGQEYQKHFKEYQRLANEWKKQGSESKEKAKELQEQAKAEEKIAKELQEQAMEQEILAKETEEKIKSSQAETISSESKIVSLEKKNIKKKAKELETIFLKMAFNAQDAKKNISSRVDPNKLKTILHEELLKRGVDLIPEFGISYFPRNNKPGSIDYYLLFNSPNYIKILPAMVTMPLFPDDVFEGNIIIKVDYLSTTNFVIKQMAGLMALSLFITILIGFVMIYIFRRMLSQEKLHQLKNDFINNMTHELKTPIATISLALEGINNPTIKNDNEKFDNYTTILKEENKKLNNHVERVLQMALLDKGELVLDKKQINLKPILESCMNAHQLQIQNKKAKLSFESNVERLFVTGDEFHLLSAFNNLLDNALKYSDENCEITISLNKVDDHAEVSFKDNGIGIDKNLQEKVFEKFYRAQGGNLHDVKGFGLGLSYVKSIIEAHGGTIELKSEKNKGSEFIIKLKTHAA